MRDSVERERCACGHKRHAHPDPWMTGPCRSCECAKFTHWTMVPHQETAEQAAHREEIRAWLSARIRERIAELQRPMTVRGLFSRETPDDHA